MSIMIITSSLNTKFYLKWLRFYAKNRENIIPLPGNAYYCSQQFDDPLFSLTAAKRG